MAFCTYCTKHQHLWLQPSGENLNNKGVNPMILRLQSKDFEDKMEQNMEFTFYSFYSVHGCTYPMQ
jgi:hypothetical protein